MTSDNGPANDETKPEISRAPTRAVVTFDDGPVTLLIRRAPVGNSGPIRGHSLAVFPVQAEPSPSETAVLGAAGTTHFAAIVEPGSRPAVAVLRLSQTEAAAIGATLGLAQVFFWDGRRADLIACELPAS